MVNGLTQADKTAIDDAIKMAEQHTSARISIVVLPSSDHYRDFILLYGLVLGSIASLLLLARVHLIYPWLLGIQLAVITLVDFIPLLRRLCIRLVPQRVRYHRAAEAAHCEYLTLHADIPKDVPFVLLFISLAERYMHVVTSPVVHKQIPENWGAATGRFIGSIRKEGLRAACIQTLEHIVEIVAPHFPAK